MRRRYGVWPSFAIAALALFAASLVVFAPQARAQDNQADGATICVVVPHFKDEYWLSVGFGLQEQARAAGVDLLFYEAGGYHALRRQISLLATCVARGADAILLGAVSADAPELLAAVRTASKTVPVLALVNELRSPDISGAIGVDWTDMGAAVGRYLALRHPKGTPPVRIGFITGPEDSGWSPLLEGGLRHELEGTAVSITITRHADTGLREQLREVEAILAAAPGLDYLVGSAPAIEGAMGLAARAEGAFPKLIATYISHSVRRGLQGGKVIAVPFDDPVEQGRLGIRAAVRSMQGETSARMEGPEIVLIDSNSTELPALPLSPAGLILAIE